ncbi:MAG: hypothetical protein WCI04_06535 [archaeon]
MNEETDIHNSKKRYFVFEVETGTQSKKLNNLIAKTNKNNSNIKPKYSKWWVVVTDKYLKPNYEKHHKTLTRTEVKNMINGLFYDAQ